MLWTCAWCAQCEPGLDRWSLCGHAPCRVKGHVYRCDNSISIAQHRAIVFCAMVTKKCFRRKSKAPPSTFHRPARSVARKGRLSYISTATGTPLSAVLGRFHNCCSSDYPAKLRHTQLETAHGRHDPQPAQATCAAGVEQTAEFRKRSGTLSSPPPAAPKSAAGLLGNDMPQLSTSSCANRTRLEASKSAATKPVSYTHLRAHET